MDKYILREDYDNNKLKEHREKLRKFKEEIIEIEKKGIENDFKEYLEENPTLTYDEIEILRKFIQHQMKKQK